MVRLADGDRTAFCPLHARISPLFRRFAARALAGAGDAEDAAQVALLKVFSNASDFDRERDALSWLLGIIAFECRTFRKRARRRREDTPEQLPERPAPDPSPEDVAIGRELERAALEALGALRAADAETIRLAAMGQRPTFGQATFRKRLERALARWRAAWSSKNDLG